MFYGGRRMLTPGIKRILIIMVVYMTILRNDFDKLENVI